MTVWSDDYEEKMRELETIQQDEPIGDLLMILHERYPEHCPCQSCGRMRQEIEDIKQGKGRKAGETFRGLRRKYGTK